MNGNTAPKGRRFLIRLHGLRITTKLLLAYVLLGMLPLLIFIGVYSYYLADEQQKSLAYEKHTSLQQSVMLLESRLRQTDMSHQILQLQVALLDLLNNSYRSASDELFAYNSQIEPSFTSILSDPAVAHVQVYRYRLSALSYMEVVPYINDIGDFPYGKEVLEGLQTEGTVWRLDFSSKEQPLLVFFTNLYTQSYSRVIGVLEIQLQVNLIFDNLNFIREGEALYLHWDGAYYPIQSGGALLGEGVPEDRLESSSKFTTSPLSASIPGTDMELVYYYLFEQTASLSILRYVSLSLVFLLLPSLVFWRYSNRFALKLQKFSQHIHLSRKTRLAPYEEDRPGNDEFTVVVTEYNKLIASVEKLTESVREAEKLKSEANFYALTSQIHPHFLFNTLENIRMHIEIDETDSAKNMLFILSRFLRYNISMQQESTLLEEINHVRNYLLIHQYRQKKILFQISLPEELQDVACPFCILQPIVENSLRHGQAGGRPLEISIHARPADGKFLVEIADNGQGIPPDRLEELNRRMESSEGPKWDPPEEEAKDKGLYSGGVGLNNVNNRLKFFYDSSCGLRFRQNDPQGTVCTLILGRQPSEAWKGASPDEYFGSGR